MSMPINDGGPAFPQHLAFGPNGEAVTAGMYFAEGPGMTLRDWFAGQALPAVIQQLKLHKDGRHEIDRVCYELADAMLAERAKGGAA